MKAGKEDKKAVTGRITLLSAAVLAMTLLLSGQTMAGVSPMAERTGFFFDTVITISLYDTGDEAILDECFEKMAWYESILSRTREGSDVWNIDHSKGKTVTVNDDTIDLIERSLAWCEASDGALDITIAPVVDLWDFHEDSERQVPDADTLSKAAALVDYRQVAIDGNEVTLADPEAGIDLGAIAKGYISDRVRDIILENGCKSALINLGGNVLAVGKKPDGKDFNIGIRRPFGESAYDLIQVVPASDMSVITSGTYERYFEKDGVIYHHILDPETGYPVENGLTSVTILSADGTDGDALSTTCFALGLEDGMDLIESLDGIEAMMIDEDGNIHASSGWTGKDL
ncbi:MAG: FAD:protein FMN transferase [Lachnospiraceae bacterium]|nr:FAD:protein FMN transferase [Lachnospiraceae bacterium]